MFCKHCGKQIEDNIKFCPYCGGRAVDDTEVFKETGSKASDDTTYNKVITETGSNQLKTADGELSNKYVWALATVPILVSWIVVWLFGISALSLSTTVTLFLNFIFLSMDVKMLKSAGIDPGKWLWLGIVFVPVYLFMRASKTDKKYSYGIVWCVMFLIDLI